MAWTRPLKNSPTLSAPTTRGSLTAIRTPPIASATRMDSSVIRTVGSQLSQRLVVETSSSSGAAGVVSVVSGSATRTSRHQQADLLALDVGRDGVDDAAVVHHR